VFGARLTAPSQLREVTVLSIPGVDHVYEANVFGPMEMGLAFVVILLLFGAKRIPEIAGSFGKGIKEFKKSMTDVQDNVMEPPASSALPTDSQQVREENIEAREPKRLL